ncbi:MAG: SDR family oxidoreductase [Caldilineaceae bacterium]
MIEHDTLPLAGRVAVITGASRRIGIGAAIARAFAARGADLFLTYYRPYDAEMPWDGAADDVTDPVAELQAPAAAWPTASTTCRRLDVAPSSLMRRRRRWGRCTSWSTTPQSRSWATSRRWARPHSTGTARSTCAAWRCSAPSWCAGSRRPRRPHHQPHVGAGCGRHADGIARHHQGRGGSLHHQRRAHGHASRHHRQRHRPRHHRHRLDQRRAAPRGPRPRRGRVGRPEDAARLVAFLASDEAAWITGQIMRSRGGL